MIARSASLAAAQIGSRSGSSTGRSSGSNGHTAATQSSFASSVITCAAQDGSVGGASGDRFARDHLRASRKESAITRGVGGRARLLAGDALIAQLPDREDRHLDSILGVAAAGLDLDLARVRRDLV